MDIQARMDLLARQAEQLIEGERGLWVRLYDPALIAARERSLVVRCAMLGWDGVTSVVLKRNEGDDARGFTDWAALAFLSSLDAAAGITPRFYAGDAGQRLFAMEDLGGSRSLADVLDAGPATAIVAALELLAATMARLVVATVGREAEFMRARAALPGAAALGRYHEAARWLEARGKVEHWPDALDIPLPHGFDDACALVASEYAEPGDLLAFSHGDPAPSNNHLGPDRVRLVDFEYAGYRHALYDLTGWAVLCPLPWEWVGTMERTFRRVIGESVPGHAFGDDGRYVSAWAMMCAYRALAMLTWFSPDLLARDQPWTPGWSRRAALLSTALRLHQVCSGTAGLAPLADLGGTMAAALQARWPHLGDGALHWPAPDGTL